MALFQLPVSHAQQFSITDTLIVSCSGVLHDSGGLLENYGDNESYTTTICPSVAGGHVTLNWISFDLSTVGNEATWDRIEVWDGENTNATYLGSYTGTMLSGLIVSATMNNPTGCLTLRWTSNQAGTGDFAAAIICSAIGSGCLAPVAIDSTVLADTVLCIGDTLFLNGTHSIPVPGSNIVEWRWNTGITMPISSSAPMDTLVISQGGVYAIQLQVVDQSGCVSPWSDARIVLVSGPVNFFNSTAPETVCIPGEAQLNGQATITPFVHTSFAGGQYGPGIYLPDDIGIPFTSTYTYTGAPFGSTVTDPSEIGDICLELEHSFMGDLFIQLECPNGNAVVLHQQGGGGTFLGDANDMDDSVPVPGTCWQYCFNTDPDHGTWVQHSNNGNTPNLVAASQGMALAPGAYSPVTSLNNLIGCPFNGDWKVTIIDLWAADNGYLCSWSLGFSVVVDSSHITATGSLDLHDAVRTFWTGANVIHTADPTVVAVPVTGSGTNDYTFTVIDSHGCAHDTTFTIQGHVPPVVDAGSDVSLCAPTAMLNGLVEFGIPDTCTYRLGLYRSNTSGNPGSIVRVVIAGDTTSYGYTAAMGMTYTLDIPHGASIELLYQAGTSNSTLSFRFYGPTNESLYESGWGPPTGVAYTALANCSGIIPPTGSILWSPTVGVPQPGQASTAIYAPAEGWYTLTASYPNGCSISDSVWVTDGTFPLALDWAAADLQLCAELITGATYTWFLNNVFNITTSSPCLNSPVSGQWRVIATTQNGCVHVSDTLLTCPYVSLHESSGFVLASGSGALQWFLNGDPIPSTGSSVPVTTSGTYSVIATWSNGCVVTAELEVLLPVGIATTPPPSPLRILPNPNTGTFRVQCAGLNGSSGFIRIIDVTGRLIRTEPFQNWSEARTVSLEHVEQGAYFVELIAGTEHHIAKLVVER